MEQRTLVSRPTDRLEQWRDGRASLEVSALDGHVQTLPVRCASRRVCGTRTAELLIDRLEGTRRQDGAVRRRRVARRVRRGARRRERSRTPDAVLATLTGDLYDVAVAAAVAASATPAISTAPPIAAGKGPLVLLARITGSLESPAYAADLEIGPGMVQARSDLAPVENLQVRAHLENGLIELRDFAGSYHGAMVTATRAGAAGSGDGRHTAALLRRRCVTSRDRCRRHLRRAGPFVDASTLSQVGGSLDAQLDLSSASLNLDDVEGEVVLERLNLRWRTCRYSTHADSSRGPRRRCADRELGVGKRRHVDRRQRAGPPRQSAGGDSGEWEARCPAAHAVFWHHRRQHRRPGRDAPVGYRASHRADVNGDVRLANGELRLREPRIVASDLNATAVLARGNAFITSLSGTVNGGMLSGSGQVQYTPEVQGHSPRT